MLHERLRVRPVVSKRANLNVKVRQSIRFALNPCDAFLVLLLGQLLADILDSCYDKLIDGARDCTIAPLNDALEIPCSGHGKVSNRT